MVPDTKADKILQNKGIDVIPDIYAQWRRSYC